ncbi:MAG: aminopeptidase P family N-terminal domain-containing protein, partial [Candidatus Desantisbacteria bacterium]
MNEIISKRLKYIHNYLEEKGMDCLLVSQADNRRYLSGFTGSAGALLISIQRVILATDFRYVEQAKIQAPLFEIFQTKGEVANWLPGLVSSQ